MNAMSPLELNEARIRLGFTQEKLASELGVHRFTLIRWESGEHKVPRMLDLALKQLKREQRRLKAARRRKANRRKRVKFQTDTARTGNRAVAGSKPKPGRITFLARGEMGTRGIEFSSASVALVVPHAKISQKKEANHVSEPSIVPEGESSDNNKKPESI